METHARTRVLRGRSAAGPWESWHRTPSPEHAGLVIELWAGVSSHERLCHRVFPNGEVSVMLHLGPPQRLVERGGKPADEVLQLGFVAGLQDGPAAFEAIGPTSSVAAVRLSPIGAWRLFGGLPQVELARQVVEIDAVLGAGSGIGRLRECMQAAPRLGAALDLLEDWLEQRFRVSPAPHAAAVAVTAAVDRSAGDVSVESLARTCGVSPRRLREIFLREVGVPAARLTRIVRFRHALEGLATSTRGDLARLAQSCGYYDQPHFNRDFRDLAGMTPIEYLDARDQVHSADVLPG